MLADRSVIRLSGVDVRGFLQGLLTADLGHIDAGPVWAGLLTPQGKALFDMLLWLDGEDVLIDCETDQAVALARRLAVYRLRRPITIAPESALAVHWSADGTQGSADPRLAVLGRRWLAAPGPATQGWHEHRLAFGVTEGAAELGQDRTLWLECNARELNGVSFTKGCYVGQENTARMHHRAKVQRRLVVAPLGPETPRTRAVHPALGCMIELRRVDALGDALIPDWLTAALGEDARKS